MSLKDAVNAALYRTTGYRFTHETPEQRQQALREAAQRAKERVEDKHRRLAAQREERAAQRRAAAQARKAEEAARREAERQRKEAERQAEEQRKEAERQAEQQRRAEEQAARVARGDDLPRDYDASTRAIIARVRSRTMTHPRKVQAVIEAIRYVVREGIPGEIVECGVWRGGSMQAVALALLELGVTDRELHLFDTFEGMPPPSDEDTRTTNGETVRAQDMLAESDKDSRVWAIADLDDVKQGMSEIAYPSDKVHYHPGLVEDTTPGQAPERIAVLRLDTDWYASTLHELEVLYDRLSPGGVLILDDYGDWDGAQRATDEWLAKSGEGLFLAPMVTGRIAIKPPGPRR